MKIVNNFYILLFATVFFNAIIAQDPTGGTLITEEITKGTDTTTLAPVPTSTSPTIITQQTTAAPPCPEGEFPLFGPKSCISRSAYTGIFLSSIILAGISFLLLLGLLGWILMKYCKGSGGSESDEESGIGDGDSYKRSAITSSQPPRGGSTHNPSAVTKITGSTPLDKPLRQPKNPTSSGYTSPTAGGQSSAPYTDAKPVSTNPKSSTHNDSNPGDRPHRSRRAHDGSSQDPPSSRPRKPTSPDGRTGQTRRTHERRAEKDETSQF